MKHHIRLSPEFIQDLLNAAFEGKGADPNIKILVDIEDENHKTVKTVRITATYDPSDATYAVEWVP